MSSLKAQPQKFSVETRVLENIKNNFPEYPCTLADLRYPKKDFVVQFFTFFLEELRVNTAKIKHSPLEEQLQGETHPELYNETLQLINLAQTLKTLHNKINPGPIFGLEDLTDPNAGRNTVFMFNFLNFYCFADSRVSELVDKLDVITQRKSDMDEYLAKNEMLAREVNQRAINKGKRLKYVEEVRVKRGEIEEIQKESKSLEQVFEKKQSDLEDVRRHNSRTHAMIIELKKKLEQLESQIVRSPDVITKTYQNLKQKLEETKLQLKQGQDTLLEKKRSIKLFENVEKDQDVRMSLLTEIVSEAKIVKELEKQEAEVKFQLKGGKEEIDSLQTQLNALKNEVVALETQLTNLQLQWEKVKRSLKENIRHLKEERENLEHQQSSEMKEITTAISDLRNEVDNLIETNHKLNKYYEKKYALLNQREEEFITQKLAQLEITNFVG